MLAVVKTHHIDFTVSGEKIPDDLIALLKEKYAGSIFFCDGSEEYESAQDMDWYKKTKAEMHGGSYLRNYRKMSKMTQTDLAKKLDTSKQFISNLENGRRPISRKMAIALGIEFGVTPGRFIEG